MTSSAGGDDPTFTLEQLRQLDRLCDAFEKAWKSDSLTSPQLEDYLNQLPAELHSAALRELLSIERSYRRRRGLPFSIDGYRSRFPQFIANLEGALPDSSSEAIRIQLAAGQQFGHYTVAEWIGAGGMGAVYRAIDHKLQREVALKTLHNRLDWDAEALERIRVEARSLAALNHPNIVTVHDFFELEGIACIVLELLEGETLADRLRRGAIPPPETLRLASQLARGLAAAHDRNIVHRDLKPRNIFITRDGVPKLLDFGLARLIGPASVPPSSEGDVSATAHGTRIGTVGYMSPEQVRGEPVDARSDVFSFGCVLYETLHGNAPFRRSTISETDRAILTDSIPPIASPRHSLTPALDRLIERCTRKAAAERFPSARELSQDLSRIERQQQRRSQRYRWLERAVFAAIGLAVIVLSVGWWRDLRVKARIEKTLKSIPVLAGDDDRTLDQLKIAVRDLNRLRTENPSWGATIEQVIRGSAGSPEHHACLMAYLHLDGGKREDLENAQELFQRAIAINANFAPAYVGLGECSYRMSNVYGSPPEMMPQVIEFAERALEHDRGSASARVLKAIYADRYLWNWNEAKGQFEDALRLNPESCFAHQSFGNSLILRRKYAEGIAHLKRAERQDPDAIAIINDLALAYMYSGDLGEAEAYYQRALTIDGHHFPARWGLGELFIRRKNLPRATSELETACRLDGSPEALAELAWCLARDNRRAEAESTLAQLSRMSSNRYVPPTALAIAQTGLGRNNDALVNLERGVKERDEWLLWIDVDSLFSELRGQPRFESIRTAVGLDGTADR